MTSREGERERETIFIAKYHFWKLFWQDTRESEKICISSRASKYCYTPYFCRQQTFALNAISLVPKERERERQREESEPYVNYYYAERCNARCTNVQRGERGNAHMSPFIP
jgi:hypothetical protein